MTVIDHLFEEVNAVFRESGVSIVDDTKTVNELLWGFEDVIFQKLGEKFGQNEGASKPIRALWRVLAETFADFTFGMVMGKNVSYEEGPSSWDILKVRNGNGNNCIDGKSPCFYRTAEILSWKEKTY